MKITWKITKKRGNWRPVLKWEMVREGWEVALAIPQIKINTPFPKHQEWSNSNLNENRLRDSFGDTSPKTWKKKHFWEITTPLSSENPEKTTDALILPWKPGARPVYPAVSIVFKALQRKYEKELKRAYDSAPFEYGGTLEMSSECKKHVAPGIAARKMLKAVGNKT